MHSIDHNPTFALHFGTGGIRAKMGDGPTCLNAETVSIATQGLADHLLSRNEGIPAPVIIARDTRANGEAFVRAVSEVLAANGIGVRIIANPSPTPLLSFAVRQLRASAGIVITASHNAAEYNGYKVYAPDGCQITTSSARAIQVAIDAAATRGAARRLPYARAVSSGLVSTVPGEVAEAYANAVLVESVDKGATADRRSDLTIVYTPLNGTGARIVPSVLARDGFSNVVIVPEQETPDGAFPTCPYPNPEDADAMLLALELAKECGANLVLATDPDADRVGVAVRHEGGYRRLTGNQVGVLLLDWVCRMREEAGQPVAGGVAVTTVVSSAMADVVARRWGVELRRTLTGFKYVGEQIGQLEAAGDEGRFLLGIEESLGYLTGTYVRDKDGVLGCMLVAELAHWHRARGRTLVDALRDAYGEYGWHRDAQVSVAYEGDDGQARMGAVMDGLRAHVPAKLAGLAVEHIVDYARGVAMPGDPTQTLPAADVLEYGFAGGSKLIIRPSGTEPKVKAYVFACASTEDTANELLGRLVSAARDLLDGGSEGEGLVR